MSNKVRFEKLAEATLLHEVIKFAEERHLEDWEVNVEGATVTIETPVATFTMNEEATSTILEVDAFFAEDSGLVGLKQAAFDDVDYVTDLRYIYDDVIERTHKLC